MTIIEELEKQIEQKLVETREIRKHLREEKLKTKRAKSSRPRGRPAISTELLQRAELLAIDKPLAFVSLKLNIALKTLYNYGISRKAINAKIDLKD